MANSIKHYKIYCTSEQAWRHWYLPSTDPVPTTCSFNTLHNVDTSSVVVVGETAVESERTPDNILYTVPHPSSLLYEMCDRDMLIKTGIYDVRASATIAGVDINGTIVYTSTWPGCLGNLMSVEYTAGASGSGHENRALDAALSYTGNIEIIVTYGTDGSGNPIIPTGGQVATMLAAKTDILMYAFPTLAGDGSSLVQITAKTVLTGGVSNSVSDVKINPTNYTKSAWCELQPVGVFKSDGGGGYVECTNQGDADTNACLSIWSYVANNQTTRAPQVIEIRDGLIYVDPTISDSLEHQSYAVGAPQIPAVYGGQVLQFDAYLKFYKGSVLGATSPQAEALDPNGPGGRAAAELRIFIYYPAGTKNTHVLRLVTYRPPGTF